MPNQCRTRRFATPPPGCAEECETDAVRKIQETDEVHAGSEDIKPLAFTNYGHFTSMRVERGGVRGLDLHLQRLTRDCRAVFGTELDPDHVRFLARKAVQDARAEILMVRVTVFDPDLQLGRPGAEATPQIMVTARPADTRIESAMRVRTVSYTRDRPETKHVGLFGALLERRRAQVAGYDDALFVDRWAMISEGPTWNVGFFDGERVIWPDAACLPGVTMSLLRQVHSPSVVLPMPRASVGDMEVAFATNAAIAVRVVKAIDDVEFAARHPVIDLLRKEYAEIRPDPL